MVQVLMAALVAISGVFFAGVDFNGRSASTSTFSQPGDFAENPGSGQVVPPSGDNAAVPEPATMLLLGSGLAGLAAWKRKKK